MTQLARSAGAPRFVVTPPVARVASVTAATILGAVGLVVASTGIALTIADGVLASGRVEASPSDLAIFQAILPSWGLIVLFGAMLVVGGVGALDRRPVGRVLALLAAGMVLVPAVGVQLGGAAGAIDVDATGRAVAAVMSGLAGVAMLGVAISARD